ncbi:MAG: BPTI/Kunitz domain-containing protein [Saprospiraceae bacterium]|nr:BPTI/Kunitz domain-containing protein [Saprospiraceae bacterium]
MKELFIILVYLPLTTFGQLDSACYLVPDIGPCFGAITKYYYDSNTNNCQSFICDGVVPFNTLQECENNCLNNTVSIGVIDQKIKKDYCI